MARSVSTYLLLLSCCDRYLGDTVADHDHEYNTCRAHSKTVGGLPLVSDTFLLQKQQTFNRSKNLERESIDIRRELERALTRIRHGAPVRQRGIRPFRVHQRHE